MHMNVIYVVEIPANSSSYISKVIKNIKQWTIVKFHDKQWHDYCELKPKENICFYFLFLMIQFKYDLLICTVIVLV